MITITPRQFDVLKIYYEYEQRDMFLPDLSNLSIELRITQATVNEHLQHLIDADLIKRLRRGPCKRNYRITESGKKLVEDHI